VVENAYPAADDRQDDLITTANRYKDLMEQENDQEEDGDDQSLVSETVTNSRDNDVNKGKTTSRKQDVGDFDHTKDTVVKRYMANKQQTKDWPTPPSVAVGNNLHKALVAVMAKAHPNYHKRDSTDSKIWAAKIGALVTDQFESNTPAHEVTTKLNKARVAFDRPGNSNSMRKCMLQVGFSEKKRKLSKKKKVSYNSNNSQGEPQGQNRHY
jgi:hypothetical protein